MSFEAIQEEAAHLSHKERKELIGYLISLNEAHRQELARKIDCKAPLAMGNLGGG